MELWDLRKRREARTTEEYRKTNKVWNKYHLNKRENIGHSMLLIKECKPNSFSEWQSFYEKSGQEAKKAKTGLTFHSFEELRKTIRIINSTHGKTKEDLEDLAKEFQNLLKQEGLDYDLETCFNYVYLRAVDETYLGYQREMTAERALKDFCNRNSLSVQETTKEDDVLYGVDYEIYKDNKLLAGIQVKGSVYKKAVEISDENTVTAIREADKLLHDINNNYTKDKKAPVLNLYVEKDFTVKDTQVFKDIKSLLNNPPSLEDKLLKAASKISPASTYIKHDRNNCL